MLRFDDLAASPSPRSRIALRLEAAALPAELRGYAAALAPKTGTAQPRLDLKQILQTACPRRERC